MEYQKGSACSKCYRSPGDKIETLQLNGVRVLLTSRYYYTIRAYIM